MSNGYFITFEGVEGAGKSTQLIQLRDRLRDLGYPVVTVREPGTTELGERVRSILADSSMTSMTHKAECYLFAAARAQLVETVIRPQLGEGAIVLCDRFTDATLAYQGFGRGVPESFLRDLNEQCSWGVLPNMTILLDIEPEIGLGRVRTRSLKNLVEMDRFEHLDLGFFNKVREGYLDLAKEEPYRFRVFSGSQNEQVLSDEIFNTVTRELEKRLPDPRKLRISQQFLSE